LDKLALGRELLAGLESAELDPFPEEPSDLAIGRAVVGPVNFS
jgi:hypothetical protein